MTEYFEADDYFEAELLKLLLEKARTDIASRGATDWAGLKSASIEFEYQNLRDFETLESDRYMRRHLSWNALTVIAFDKTADLKDWDTLHRFWLNNFPAYFALTQESEGKVESRKEAETLAWFHHSSLVIRHREKELLGPEM